MIEKAIQAIRRHGMFQAGMRVGVAVSGGADSMGLLHLLALAAPRWDLRLSVAHVDHGMRSSSGADAEFVRQAAARLNLPFHLRQASVPSLGGNPEQTARRVRRQFFQELLEAGEAERIATGHTRDDQAETVLYRILRGSGLTGLRGILPVTAEGLVRPLLYTGRDELRAWVRMRGIEWREDETNQDRYYARNRLRHEILPLLREHFNPAVQQALAHLAALAQEEEDFWESRVLPRIAARAGACQILEVRELLAEHPAVARRRIRQMFQAVGGTLERIEFAHVEAVLAIARRPDGHGRVQVPGLEAVRSLGWIRIAAAGQDRPSGFCLPVSIPGSVVLPDDGGAVFFTLGEPSQMRQTCDTVDHELDWQRLARVPAPESVSLSGGESGLLELRNWRPGDRFHRAGESREIKLKLLFQQARVPVWERWSWPVLTVAGRIAWTRKFGVSADFAPRPGGGLVLRIRYIRSTL